MNYNNLAQRTNFIASSDKFKNIPFYLTDVNIPGLSMNNPESGAKYSTRLNLSADTINYNPLSFEMLIDEDFEIYKELMNLISANISASDGTFKDFSFDFFIELNNSKGYPIMKLDFFNCRIASIGDIMLSSQDEETEHTLSFEMVYDYFEIVKENPYTKVS